MNEHRGSTSEGIWIGLCVLLLLVTGAVGAFGFMQYRRVVAAEEAKAKAMVSAAQSHAERLVATERAAQLSIRVVELEHDIGRLQAESQELRERLADAAE
jgi:hypothetical protein